jgi:hypothetical protein
VRRRTRDLSLALIAREKLQQDPRSGTLLIFTNARHDRIEALWWDQNGYCILYNQPSSYCTFFGSRSGSYSLATNSPKPAWQKVKTSPQVVALVKPGFSTITSMLKSPPKAPAYLGFLRVRIAVEALSGRKKTPAPDLRRREGKSNPSLRNALTV